MAKQYQHPNPNQKNEPVQLTVKHTLGPVWTIRVPRAAAHKTIEALSGKVVPFRRGDAWTCRVEDVPELRVRPADVTEPAVYGPDDGAGGWPFVKAVGIALGAELGLLWIAQMIARWIGWL